MPAAGVYKKEIDLSLYVEISSDLKVGCVHTFSKGPVNQRTLIKNLAALESTFGKPIDDNVACQGFFALREYLRNGNQAFVVRAESAVTPATSGVASIRGGTDESLATNTDGATSIPATRTLTSALASFIVAGAIVGDVLEVSGGADAGFYNITNVAATVLTVDRDWPTGSLTGQTYTVWVSKRSGAADGVSSVAASRTLTSASSKFISAGVQAGDVLSINDISTAADNGFYVITAVPSETSLTVNSNFPAGSLTALTFSVYGRSHPIGTDGTTAVAGEFSSATAKFNSHKIKAGDLLVVNDISTPGNNGTYVITGLKTGFLETTLLVNVGTWGGGSLTNLTFSVLPGVVGFTGESKGTWVNGYALKTVRNANDSSKFDVQIYDADGYLQETVSSVSLASIVSDFAAGSATFPTAAVSTLRVGPAIAYTSTASGGTDGLTGLTSADLIGTGNKGLQLFKNIEEVELDLLLIPGYSTQQIGDALLNMAESTRGDCLALVDPPAAPTVTTPQDVVNWHNGAGSFGRTSALNSSFGATYWAWQSIYDPYHDVDRYTAPSGHLASVFAQSDNLAKPWFAPAGLRRGKVKGSQACYYSPDGGERTFMQVGANVNPIVNFINDGIHVYGQKTLLRTDSALNRVNVRRMLLFLERQITKSVRTIVFEPNDPTTDRELVRIVTPICEYVQDNRGLREFLVIADDTTSPPAVRAANKLIGKIFIKPTTTAEMIELQFVLTAQSVVFSELLAG